MIEHTAADAVVGVGRDGDGNRRRGRRRIVVGFRGIGVDFIFACLRESKVRTDRGVGLRSGRLAKHLIICHGRPFLHALDRENRQDLLADSHSSLGNLQRKALSIFLPCYRNHKLGGYAVIIGSRHTDYGSISGLDILDGQFCFFRKNSAILTVIVPFIGNVGAVLTIRGFCCRGKCYGIAGIGSECIAALASCNAVACDFNISHRRIADLHVALRVCRSLGRENPFAI